MWVVAFVINPDGKQINLFFASMQDFLADASNTTGLSSRLDPYHDDTIGLWNAAYPPLAYLLFYFFSRVGSISSGMPYLGYYIHPVWLMFFIISVFVLLIVLYSLIVKQLNMYRGTVAVFFGLAICLSNPVLFTIERGNVILLAAVFTSFFVFNYESENKIYKELALICLAFAAGLKMTPALFGVLLIYKRDYRAILRTVLYGLISFVAPFYLLDGGIANFQMFLHNMKMHLRVVSSESGTGLVASCYKIMQLIYGENYVLNDAVYNKVLFLSKIVAILLLLGMFFLKEKWQIVLNVSLAVMLLPSVSGKYCLLYLIPCTVLFFQKCSKKKMSISYTLVFISFIMIGFVYRCDISQFLDYNVAIPILTIVALYYTFMACHGMIKNKGEQNG